MKIKKLKLWKKIVVRVASILLLLVILLLVLLRLPPVQTFLANKVSAYISNKTNSTIAVDKVAINFIDNICLQGLFVEDDNQDTLLYAEQFTVDIAFFKLFKNIVEIDNVNIEKSRIKIVQRDQERYNFTFLAEAFSSEEVDSSSTESRLVFDLNTISILDPKIDVNLLDSKNSLRAKSVYFNIKTFDLTNNIFSLDDFSATEMEIDLETSELSIEAPTDNLAESKAQTIEFPLAGLPITIEIDNISVEDSRIFMHTTKAKNTNTFSTDYIDLNNIQLNARGIKVNDEIAELNVSQLSMNVNNKVNIKKLSFPLRFTNHRLSLESFMISTDNSTANATIGLDYDSFSNLANQSKSLKVDIDIPSIDLLLKEIEYFVPSVASQEEYLAIRNNRFRLTGKVKGKLGSLDIRKLEASMGKTEFAVTGKVNNPMDIDKLSLNNFLAKATIHYEDYFFLIEDEETRNQLRQIGDITLDSDISGSLTNMNFTDLKINTEALLYADFAGNIRSLNDPDNISFKLDIKDIRTGTRDLQIFMDSIPSVLSHFDTIRYGGQIEVTKYAFDLKGKFKTSLGNMQTIFDIEFNENYDNASYEGLLGLKDFQLGEMIDNDSLGNITMQIDIAGTGLSSEDLNTQIDGHIYEVEYNSYLYENINVDGQVEASKFTGLAEIDDENALISFNGFVDMNDSIPEMDFQLAIDTIDLYALNLYEEPLSVQLHMDSKITGIDLDDIIGKIQLDSLTLAGKDKFWKTDSITFIAKDSINSRGLFLSSDFMNGSITGDYTLEKLPQTILDFMDQYFPLQTFLGSSPKEDPILSQQEIREVRGENINIRLGWQNMEELLQFFDFPINRMDSSYFVFNLNAPDNLTDVELHIPLLNYDGYVLDSIYAVGKNTTDERLDLLLRIDSVVINSETHIADIQTDFLFTEEKAIAKLLLQADNDEQTLGTELTVKSNEKGAFSIDISDDFYLNDHLWGVQQDSSIQVSSKNFLIPLVKLQAKSESIAFSGDSKAITATFDKFRLQNLTELVKMDSLSVVGLIDGDVTLGLQNEGFVSGDVEIKNVYFNELEIGNFDLNAYQRGNDIEASILVNGESIQLDSDIRYNIEKGKVDGDIDLNKFDLRAIDPFVGEYAENVTGNIEGNINLFGTVDEPNANGKLNVTSASAYIIDLQTKYNIQEGVIDLYKDKIAPIITLEDDKQRKAVLTGEITHKYFKNLFLDLDFRAEEFTFLDSQKSRSADYYGKFVGKVDAKISGPLEKPVVDASIKALSKTDMTIQLLDATKSVSNEDYIIFFDGNTLSSDQAVDSLNSKIYRSKSGMQLNLDLQTDPAAAFHVIVDPLTGDKLDIRGTTNLLMKIPPEGDINMVGQFTVTEGLYRLSYENAIKRNFAIDEGSQIRFQGSPYSAQLDMKAIYETRTNTYALVSNNGSAIDDGSASNRATVQVVLNVEGTLSKPELSFDIQVPDNSSNTVSNSVTDALASLRSNETQLLEQVFSLILFNSFTGGSSGSNISAVGTSTAISSIGNLINNQLGKLSKNKSGFSLNFDLDQYEDISTSDGNNITEIGVGMQQKLFDDKLEFTIAGNANLETGESAANNFSSFAGDFIIRYYITEDRNMHVKVFQTSDYDALSNDSVWKTGLGLTYKKTYRSLRRKKNERN